MALFFYQFTPLYGHNLNSQHNGPKFTDKSLKKVSLSVKGVLLTDKSAKKGSLSVNQDEILVELVERHCI